MVRLDLITGFLGAGKTTFIKKYAKYHMDKNERVAVIENEFGAAGVDTAILKNDNIEVEQLVGGCICCTQKVNFHNLIICLSKSYDRIIVEPSGIFSIDDFFDILYSPQVQQVCVLGSIITIADPRALLEMEVEERRMCYLQMASAGKILLSKTTCMTPEEIRASIRQIYTIFNESFKEGCSKSLDELIVAAPWESLAAQDFEELSRSGYTRHNHIRQTFNHNTIFNSTTLYPKAMDIEELREAVTNTIDGSCGIILRIKGCVMTKEGGCIEVNCTAKDISIKLIENESVSALNFIGKNLNRKRIKHYFGA